MFFLFGSRTKTCAVRGYFECTTCRATQKCENHETWQYFHVFFMSIVRLQKVGEQIICLGCHGRFDSENFRPADSKDAEKPVLWDCPKCGNLNPNHTYRCERCRYSLV